MEHSPTDEDVNATIKKLRQLYSDAYEWDAPPLEGRAGGAGYAGRMRYKVREAINTWDLLRLYIDANPQIEGNEYEFKPSATKEDAALGSPSLDVQIPNQSHAAYPLNDLTQSPVASNSVAWLRFIEESDGKRHVKRR